LTADAVLQRAPSVQDLEKGINIRTLQLALLQQQYAPNHPLISNNPTTLTPTAELARLNVGSEINSDKVTLGDATSVSAPPQTLTTKYRALQ